MEIVSEPGADSSGPTCQAAVFAEKVDHELNGLARQEFLDSTSATQPSGADLGKGSAYLEGDLDESAVTFTRQTVVCGLCKNIATLFEEGAVSAKECLVSGSCELGWVAMHPEKYFDAESGELKTPYLICRPEAGCPALIALAKDDDNGVSATLTAGNCQVDSLGVNWRERYHEAIGLMRPQVGLEKFDGLDSGREETV